MSVYWRTSRGKGVHMSGRLCEGGGTSGSRKLRNYWPQLCRSFLLASPGGNLGLTKTLQLLAATMEGFLVGLSSRGRNCSMNQITIKA